jgi:CHAD domain-containing protein
MAKVALDDVLAMLRAQRRALLAGEPGTRRGRDPEALHGMRTAVRRLRAIMRAVRSSLDPEPTRLGRELRWLGRVLGGARDLDVLRAHLRAELASLEGADATALRHVLARLDAERTRAQAAVRSALASSRYARLRRSLDAALRAPTAGEDLAVGRIARRRFKKLCRAVDALGKTPTDRQVHAVRVGVKRARYAAELARGAVGRRAKRFGREAGRLQDILGEYQDAAVAEARLRTLLRTVGADRAAARRLLARQQHRRRIAWANFQDRWPTLERRGRKAWS